MSDEEDESADLPVMSWEAAEQRIALPPDLQKALGLPVAVLRWSRTKYERVRSEHVRDIEQIDHLSIYLRNWHRAGPQPGKSDTCNVFFEGDGRWFILVVSRDQYGSYNAVTCYGTTDFEYLERRWSHPGFVDREQ